MIFIYFWMLLFSYGWSSAQGSGGTIPKRNNEVYYWEQSSSAPGVAKYGEGKHFNVARNSSRRLFGRHVCTQNKVVMLPVKDMQSYCKPTYQSYLRRCDKDSSRYCTGYRVVYELAYRTVQRFVPKTESLYACCPGWTQTLVSSSDCKKAICREECQNGGVCTKPDHCTCPVGWTGKTCETDVNECSKKKNSCQHECVNIPGSYRCVCKEGYTLQSDGRSCQKTIDQENEIKYSKELLKKMDDIHERIQALEEWKENDEKEEGRYRREEKINSISEQIAILEERLAECSCNSQDISLPRPQK